jgi:hypothetical protein
MAFRTKKISQMDPKGANLASTDLLEISQLVSGSYVTKSITGAQIAASAPAAAWGTITGTLSAQTDLNTALSGKVPTSRTLTINGTTQDLSADRTFTISTGITIGTTAITSGTNGRFLFDDAGVVSETNGAFWDKVNSRWGIGTITPASKVDIRRTNATIQLDEFTTNSATGCLWFASTKSTSNFSIAGEGTNTLINAPSGYVGFFQGLAEKARFASATGNVLINTTTDAGFKLDVNGTARVSGQFDVVSGSANFRVLNSSTAVQLNYGATPWIYYNATDMYLQSTNIFFQGASSILYASGRGIFGSSSLGNSVQFQIDSTTRGFLPPRLTTTQKNAIASPATGLMVYDTTLNLMALYNGTTWTTL